MGGHAGAARRPAGFRGAGPGGGPNCVVWAYGEWAQTMARGSVGLGMLEIASIPSVHSLSEPPSEGGQMEKGMQMRDLIMAFIGGAALGWCWGRADWKGLWWN